MQKGIEIGNKIELKQKQNEIVEKINT